MVQHHSDALEHFLGLVFVEFGCEKKRLLVSGFELRVECLKARSLCQRAQFANYLLALFRKFRVLLVWSQAKPFGVLVCYNFALRLLSRSLAAALAFCDGSSSRLHTLHSVHETRTAGGLDKSFRYAFIVVCEHPSAPLRE